jgi:polyphosphate glucokinase
MMPDKMVRKTLEMVADWDYSVVSIGYPGPVLHGRPICEPYNLGGGWVGFNFAAAFHRPVKVVNDAAMQALGSYKGGTMLFLGLGAGLGTAMIVDGIVEPMELGHLGYKKATYEDYLGRSGLKRLGKKRWRYYVEDVVERLIAALEPGDVVIGGHASLCLDPRAKAPPPATKSSISEVRNLERCGWITLNTNSTPNRTAGPDPRLRSICL